MNIYSFNGLECVQLFAVVLVVGYLLFGKVAGYLLWLGGTYCLS